MKYGNRWTFGIIFTLVSLYLIWTNFEMPCYYSGDTEFTDGLIIKSQAVPSFGRGQRQMVTYVYRANDSLYTFKKKINPRLDLRPIGAKVKIEYDTDQPHKHHIESHYKIDYYNLRTSFLYSDGKFTEEIKFHNEIVRIEKRTLMNEPIFTRYFEYMVQNDSLFLFPILSKPRKKTVNDTFVVRDTTGGEYLSNIANRKVYTQ